MSQSTFSTAIPTTIFTRITTSSRSRITSIATSQPPVKPTSNSTSKSTSNPITTSKPRVTRSTTTSTLATVQSTGDVIPTLVGSSTKETIFFTETRLPVNNSQNSFEGAFTPIIIILSIIVILVLTIIGICACKILPTQRKRQNRVISDESIQTIAKHSSISPSSSNGFNLPLDSQPNFTLNQYDNQGQFYRNSTEPYRNPYSGEEFQNFNQQHSNIPQRNSGLHNYTQDYQVLEQVGGRPQSLFLIPQKNEFVDNARLYAVTGENQYIVPNPSLAYYGSNQNLYEHNMYEHNVYEHNDYEHNVYEHNGYNADSSQIFSAEGVNVPYNQDVVQAPFSSDHSLKENTFPLQNNFGEQEAQVAEKMKQFTFNDDGLNNSASTTTLEKEKKIDLDINRYKGSISSKVNSKFDTDGASSIDNIMREDTVNMILKMSGK
ncbi:hypothetical protein HDU92_007493 [Lobulomyces angularis]|nr:hypothetical protein HDU92_007493 [Lobulomyces angularis]